MYICFIIDMRTLDRPFQDIPKHHETDHFVLKARFYSLENISNDTLLDINFISGVRLTKREFVFVSFYFIFLLIFMFLYEVH